MHETISTSADSLLKAPPLRAAVPLLKVQSCTLSDGTPFVECSAMKPPDPPAVLSLNALSVITIGVGTESIRSTPPSENMRTHNMIESHKKQKKKQK